MPKISPMCHYHTAGWQASAYDTSSYVITEPSRILSGDVLTRKMSTDLCTHFCAQISAHSNIFRYIN